jgi:hypothetical protein
VAQDLRTNISKWFGIGHRPMGDSEFVRDRDREDQHVFKGGSGGAVSVELLLGGAGF